MSLLDKLAQDGLLEKRRIGRNSDYVNTRLTGILTRDPMT